MKPTDVKIRLATVANAGIIASVLYDAFVEYEPLYTPDGFRATTPDPEIVRQRMAEGPVWTASLDEAIVGTAGAIAESADSLYIRGMAVLPSARGRFVGEMLLRQVETYARDREFQRLTLSTTPFLNRAIALYERFGFQRTDDEPHDLFGPPLFTMRKDLAAD